MYVPTQPVQSAQGNDIVQDTQSSIVPFILTFVKGNISRCAGCGRKDLRDTNGKVHPPPWDLCLLHKEFVTFENPHTGARQKSLERRNVYYHARKACLLETFDQPKVVVQSEVRVKLSAVIISWKNLDCRC